MTTITRFAPSPTGPLHLGHAFSAILAFELATSKSGVFLLRIEDIDQSRARPEWEHQIYEDLEWLGLTWPHPVMRQSERFFRYDHVLDDLWARKLLYPCHCNRRDIQDALQAPQEGVVSIGPDGIIYPGTCRPSSPESLPISRPNNVALRLNLDAVDAVLGDTVLTFHEMLHKPNETLQTFTVQDLKHEVGDFVVARRDMGTSYHLAVVLDDADQKVTDVVRGADLFDATKIHVLLQVLLDLPTPRYHHHRLIRDADGKRLAKRDDARAIATYRAEGASALDVRQMIGEFT